MDGPAVGSDNETTAASIRNGGKIGGKILMNDHGKIKTRKELVIEEKKNKNKYKYNAKHVVTGREGEGSENKEDILIHGSECETQVMHMWGQRCNSPNNPNNPDSP